MVIDEVERLLRPLAERVGFVPWDAPTPPPQRVRMWRAPYALMVLWPLDECSPEALAAAQRSGESWIEDRLLAEEAAGNALDGYLIVVLSEAPSSESLGRISDIEQDPRFCRKHVIWPDSNGATFSRMLRITSLGLPAAGGGSGPAPNPDLTEEQLRLLGLIEGMSIAGAAKRLVAGCCGTGVPE